MTHIQKTKYQSGLSLIEVMIAASIVLVTVLALLAVFNLYFKTALTNGEAIKGAYLAEEGIEAIKFLRSSSWGNSIATLTPGTAYSVTFNGTTWQTATSNFWIDGFDRRITLRAVYRDGNDDIVSSPGTLDLNTLLVTSSVSWLSVGATTTKSISTYITNLYDN